MKEIIVRYQPFILKQTVFVKNEDNTIDEYLIEQKQLSNFILDNKTTTDGTIKVHLFGNKPFLKKIQEECEKTTNFDYKKITFHYNR